MSYMDPTILYGYHLFKIIIRDTAMTSMTGCIEKKGIRLTEVIGLVIHLVLNHLITLPYYLFSKLMLVRGMYYAHKQ